jgi:phenylacetic acid degradation operon negative regulatory protein
VDNFVNARAALFDLYGDHVRRRGGEAAVAAVIELLGELDIAAPAVRTAVSRMARQGWLTAVRTEQGPGYTLTERATKRLDEAATRIYRQSSDQAWDGSWNVVVMEHVNQRVRRERVHRALEYLGYRRLHGDTWIAPKRAVEVDALLTGESLAVDNFMARYDGDAQRLLDRLWHLDRLADAYRQWQHEAEAVVAAAGQDPDDRQAFAARSALVHEWRKFLFSDPGLPRQLLPPDWPGDAAAAYFDLHAERLLPGADAFVDHCLHRRAHE